MANLTQLITRQSGMEFWYSLDNDDADASTIRDESGNGRDMDAIAPGIDRPTVTLNVLNGQKAVIHDNDTAFFRYDGAMSLRDLFTVAKVDDTPDFDDPFRGFITGTTVTTDAALLIGVGSTTKWLNVAGGAASMGYLMDDVLRAESDRQAPFNGFHRLRLSTSGTAMGLAGIQVGQDRTDPARLFKGKWADIMGFSIQRTTDEAKAIALYYDLKFDLWQTNSLEMYFPTPGMTGIAYRHFNARPRDWGDVTLSHEYEDGGRSFHEITDTPPIEWDIVFDCVDATHALAKEQYEIFDEFWDAVKMTRTFSFTDKYGTTHTGVRIKEYSRQHSEHRSWRHEVGFRLCKYP